MFQAYRNHGKLSPNTELRNLRPQTPRIPPERGSKFSASSRLLTANPVHHSDSLVQGRNLTQRTQSSKSNKNGEKGPIKAQALPDLLNMAPLTVSLLPHTGKKKIGRKPNSSPLRSPRSTSPRGGAFPMNGTDTIQLLRPNNTKIDLQKIDLDRRGLTTWPSAAAADSPRLLSLQYNQLTRIDPPFQLSSLVLLDLYHNHLKSLAGLQFLPNLKILLLAKNRLSRLEGLEHVPRLEVLDLHGNQLLHINGLSHLKELKLLNLAGNMLRHVTNMKGLESLTELNLRRNQIRTVTDLHLLSHLEKVFLSYNEICRYEDISNLQKCPKLRELSLDENPISKNNLYFHNTAVKFYRIKRLDDQELTIESRRQSERFLQKSKEREKLKAAQITDDEKRKLAINSAMRHWKTLKAAQYMIIRKRNKAEEDKKLEEAESNGEEIEITESDNSDEKLPDPSFKDIPKICEPEACPNEPFPIQDEPKNIPEIIIDTGTTKAYLEIPTTNHVKRKFVFNRSKSSIDIKYSSLKQINETEVMKPHFGSCENVSNQKQQSNTLQAPTSFATMSKSNAKVTRRHSESKLSISNDSIAAAVQLANKPKLSHGDFGNEKKTIPKPFNRILQKSASSINLKSLPERGLTATVSKIQTNLNRLHQNADVKVINCTSASPKPRQEDKINVSDSSDEDSGSEYISITSSSSVYNEEKSSTLSFSELKSFQNSYYRQICKLDNMQSVSDRNQGGILREQGPNFLAELDNKVLRLYGNGALKCTELVWDKSATTSATTVYFQYINYDDIVEIFPRLRIRFPRLENFVFVETNLTKCSQLNALAELHQVSTIQVKQEGNPIIRNPYWRHYAIFRLSHWGLVSINENEITDEERQEAACMFSPLSQLAFTCLPRQQLGILISSRSHQHMNNNIENNGENLSTSESKEDANHSSEGPCLPTPHLQELIGKEALQYRPLAKLSEEEISTFNNSTSATTNLMTWVLDSVSRSSQLEKIWPSVLHDLTRDSITDLIKPNYGKICLDSLKKDLGWKK